MKQLLLATLLALTTLATPVAQAPPPLVQPADLQYVGAFRTPNAANLRYAGTRAGFAYNPANDSLVLSNYLSQVSEITIPASVDATTVSALPVATMLQGPVDALGVKRALIGTNPNIGGLLVVGDRLVVTVYIPFDANGSAVYSHFERALDLSDPAVIGPIATTPLKPGFVAGPMQHIPAEFQAALGGPATTGLCCVSIITRTSFGPSMSVFDPADLVDGVPLPVQPLVYYDAFHRTLGDWDADGTGWNNATSILSSVFVPGTRSVLFFGRYGEDFCYGTGSDCGDPTTATKGDHAYPYNYKVWAYDVDEFIAVRQGVKQPWEVVPYAEWYFDMPHGTEAKSIRGATVTPDGRIFVGEMDASNQLIIRELRVTTAPPPPPPPPPDPVDCVVSEWTEWSAWTPVGDGTESRTRTRSVTTPEAHGGTACPVLSESEVRPMLSEAELLLQQILQLLQTYFASKGGL